jgi:hypothetical protein
MNKILTLLILIFLNCNRPDNSTQRQLELQFLLNYLQTRNPSSSVQSSCFNYMNTEALCITSPDPISNSCSDSELKRVRELINPTEKRTDAILLAFFSCWNKCVTLYNTADSICSGSKYATTKTYREKVKSGQTTASASWGSCMTTCNNGKSEEEGLKGSDATFTGQPF